MIPHENTPLGRSVAYPRRVDSSVLVPIARADSRVGLDVEASALPFHGEDLWGCYELSWLDARGKPLRAVAELRVPASSPNLVESKSLKLYLNGYAYERFDSEIDAGSRIVRDLEHAVGAPVGFTLLPSAQWPALQLEAAQGISLDREPLAVDGYGPPAPELLRADPRHQVTETVHSTLFRSNCPVTGQPDWATVVIDYTGRRIDHPTLLAYLISYRDHAGFHEQCVERIWLDLKRHCGCDQLTVHARFTRRGGLDITPLRSDVPGARLSSWRRDPVQ